MRDNICKVDCEIQTKKIIFEQKVIITLKCPERKKYLVLI